jgi:hypothetical protein
MCSVLYGVHFQSQSQGSARLDPIRTLIVVCWRLHALFLLVDVQQHKHLNRTTRLAYLCQPALLPLQAQPAAYAHCH